jgi:hypothetical protein
MRGTVTALVVVLLVMIAALVRCCNERTGLESRLADCIENGGAAEGIPLIIEGRSAGDWIQFSTLPTEQKCDPADVNFRPAVLFQFGEYSSEPDLYFSQIWIYKGGSPTPEVIEKEDAAGGVPLPWINIVAEYDDRPDPPMDPDAVFALYPDSGLPSTCTPGNCTSAMCSRNRTIHGGMEDVQAVMTYWPGEAGYTMKAEQPKDDGGGILAPCLGNHYRFTLPDPVRVEVYEPVHPDAGTPTTYDPGEVDSIVVKTAEEGPPEKEEMQLPPWPWP